MTVFRSKDRHVLNSQGKKVLAYRYDFRYAGRRYTSRRGFPTEREASDAEAELRRTLRRQAAGLEPAARPESPRFQEWAEIYLEYVQRRQQLRDYDGVVSKVRTVLRFFGRRPEAPGPRDVGPYHDLTLRDPIDHPGWILTFDTWMAQRGVSGATRNHYRVRLSRLYAVAMKPEYRTATGVTLNPFRGLDRDRPRRRRVVFTVEQLQAVIAAAPPWLQLAIAIAALAPKLRLSNILDLRWDRNVSTDLRTLTVDDHKTVDVTGQPLVAPVSAALGRILATAHAGRRRRVAWVIDAGPAIGRPVARRVVGHALAQACAAANVVYGRAGNGVTFHTIRHTAATTLAALGVPEGLRKDVLGHLTIQTTQGYTHLQPVHEAGPLEQLAAALPIEEVMAAAGGKSHRRSHQAKASLHRPVRAAMHGKR